jgi:hypothetical protein
MGEVKSLCDIHVDWESIFMRVSYQQIHFATNFGILANADAITA